MAGASSGVIGAALGSPFFLVKTRLQSYSPFLPVGTQHKYRNAIDGLRQIYGAEGVRGLYRGIGPAMVRTGFGSSVQLPTYFLAKRQLVKQLGMEEGPGLHLTSSAISGIVVCVFMHPPDTIMSRMYNQSGNLYKGAFDCLYSTIKAEGPLALYKGFTAHLARIWPHTVSRAGALSFEPMLTCKPDFDSIARRADEQAAKIGRNQSYIVNESCSFDLEVGRTAEVLALYWLFLDSGKAFLV